VPAQRWSLRLVFSLSATSKRAGWPLCAAADRADLAGQRPGRRLRAEVPGKRGWRGDPRAGAALPAAATDRAGSDGRVRLVRHRPCVGPPFTEPAPVSSPCARPLPEAPRSLSPREPRGHQRPRTGVGTAHLRRGLVGPLDESGAEGGRRTAPTPRPRSSSRGNVVMEGYYNDPRRRPRRLWATAWFPPPGNAARGCTPTGTLEIPTIQENVIITEGRTLLVWEVEVALLRPPGGRGRRGGRALPERICGAETPHAFRGFSAPGRVSDGGPS